MGEKVFDIILAVVIGSLIGGGAIYFLTRDATAARVVNGQPIEYWAKGLDSASLQGRADAIAALQQFGNDAIAQGIDALNRPSAQDAGVELLVAIGAPAQSALVEVLGGKYAFQRGGAIKAIERMKAPPMPDMLAAVARLLADETNGPQAANYLAKIGPENSAT